MYNYILDINFKNPLIDDKKILKIENKIKNGITISKDEIHSLLGFLVYNTNKILAEEKDNPYTNKCDLAQALIGYTLSKLNLDVYVLNTHKTISPNVKGHSFLVVKFNDSDFYLVDDTYRQFFLKEDCIIDKYLIINDKIILSPNPGFYINQDKNRINTIMPLLENGFIELNENIAKVYADSFLKTSTNIYKNDILPNISGNIYIKSFLKNTSNYSKAYNELEKKIILPSEKLDTLKNIKEQLKDNKISKKRK